MLLLFEMDNKEFYKRFEEQAMKEFGKTHGKIFCILIAGMGCMMYVKRNDIDKPLQYFFMHSDSWGQYGEETSEVPVLEKFMEGYKQIDIV